MQAYRLAVKFLEDVYCFTTKEIENLYKSSSNMMEAAKDFTYSHYFITYMPNLALWRGDL